MKRNKTTLLVGIDIGSSMIRALAAYSSLESPLPVPQLTIELPTEGVDKGRISDKEEVAQVISKLLKTVEEELDEKVAHIIVSFSPASLSSLHLSGFTRTSRGDALVTSLDIDQAIKDGATHIPDNKNKSILHEIPLKYKLDGTEASLPVLGLRANKLEVRSLYITCQKQLLDTLKDVFQKIQITPHDIIAGPLAESVPLLTKKERKSGVLLVNIGASTTSLVVYENNNPLLVSTLPIGGNDITKDIAIGMKITPEDAEDIKCGRSTMPHSKRRVEEIIEARIEDICDRINKELETIHRKELLPSGVVVTGKGSLIPKLDYMMRNELRLPIKFAYNTLIDYTHGSVNDESFSRCYGALFFMKDFSESEVFFTTIANIARNAKKYIARFLP